VARRLAVAAMLVLAATSACHRVPMTPDEPFDQSEKIFTGQYSRIVEAAGHAMVDAQLTAERQFQTYDGATFIVAHPASSPTSVGSVVVRLKEVGSDDTSVGVQIKRSLLALPADRAALADKILSTIAQTHDK
jgi:hypothetical protein